MHYPRSIAVLSLFSSLVSSACSDRSAIAPAPPMFDGSLDAAAQPRDQTWTLMSGGRERSSNVHLAAGYDGRAAVPLVLNFHGYSSNPTEQAALTGMNPKADAEGFVVLYPQGIGNSWNAGASCCGDAQSQNIDDVAFVRDLLDLAATRLKIDTRRVFVTGMSNGGYFSHRLGCELSDRVAAIAPVSGVLSMPPACNPSRAMPVLDFHGTADVLVSYQGWGTDADPSVPDTIAGWAKRDGCTDAVRQTFKSGDTTCMTQSACSDGVEVTLCTIDGGGHTWPGGQPYDLLGKTTTAIAATDAMWEFFQQHPLP